MLKSINPYTQELIAQYSIDKKENLDKKLEALNEASFHFKRTSINDRIELLKSIKKALTQNVEIYAKAITDEMGKLHSEAKAEVKKCHTVLDYYIENAEEYLADSLIETGRLKSYVTKRPVGIVYGIMPWNFPFWQVFRFAIPALVAGNVVLLKHAGNVSGCATLLERLINRVELGDIFKSIYCNGQDALEIIKDKRVGLVTFTGSCDVGRLIGACAGQFLKKSILELGGSDPYLVFPDVDLEKVALECAKSRLLNSGQSCIGAKRIIVHADIYDKFNEALENVFKNYKQGNPYEQDVTLGPLAKKDFVKTLVDQRERALDKGAKLVYASKSLNENFFPITILKDLNLNNPIAKEEVFGPLACVYQAMNQKEMVQIANASPFGLGASIFTKDLDMAEKLAKHELIVGSCFINEMVKSDSRLPFGGVKESGYGRELSWYGLNEFTNHKTICINK